MNIDQVAAFLEISSATVRNWIKHNYLTPVAAYGKPRFSAKNVRSFKEDLINGRIARLRKRANKNKSTSTALPSEYLSDHEKIQDVHNAVRIMGEYGVGVEEGLFFLTLNLLGKEGLVTKIDHIDDVFIFDKNVFRHNQIRLEMKNWAKEISFKSNREFQLRILSTHIPQVQDFLGVVYQTLRLEGHKSQSGAYYTPRYLVEDIVTNYARSADLKVLDPCCGTGQFLLVVLNHFIATAGEAVALRNVWGADIDSTAVQIARINVIVRCKAQDNISPNIYCQNTLLDDGDDLFAPKPRVKEAFFDLVITNPPWGAKYSNEELEHLSSLFPDIQSGESFSFFLEKGIRYLKDDGMLCYILPESFLNIRMHRDIRRKILSGTSVQKIFFLNRVFKNVFTPVIRMDIQKRNPALSHQIDILNGKEFRVEQTNFINNGDFAFSINIDRKDNSILEKIFSQNYFTLAGKADWALGIVTGDNAKFLLNEQLSGCEGVLTGQDIFKFRYRQPTKFIRFEPEKFQQTAPEAKYRMKEKLIYRFISQELIFSYDDKQALTLNSVNILIPQIEGYPAKAILGLLNSSLYQFIFQKKFNSLKVLKAHIEALPLPDWSMSTINELVALVDGVLEYHLGDGGYHQSFVKLDEFIMIKWGLTKTEMEHIANHVNSKEYLGRD